MFYLQQHRLRRDMVVAGEDDVSRDEERRDVTLSCHLLLETLCLLLALISGLSSGRSWAELGR